MMASVGSWILTRLARASSLSAWHGRRSVARTRVGSRLSGLREGSGDAEVAPQRQVSIGFAAGQPRPRFPVPDRRGWAGDGADLDRIRALVIPPAWTDVWICPLINGHLQATGLDSARRRQYIYHACRDGGGWRELDSADMNAYLKELFGQDVSAKDFRTWLATVLAAVGLAVSGHAATSPSARRRAVSPVVAEVTGYLSNTPAVCAARLARNERGFRSRGAPAAQGVTGTGGLIRLGRRGQGAAVKEKSKYRHLRHRAAGQAPEPVPRRCPGLAPAAPRPSAAC